MDAIRRPPIDERTIAAGERGRTAALAPPADESARVSRLRETREGQRGAQDHVGTARQRASAGEQRDLEAHARDRAAALRDLQAQVRDELSETLTKVGGRPRAASARGVITRATLDRQRAAEDRALAAEHRDLAAQNREHAAQDRLLAMRDRAAAVAEQQLAEADDLTGVLRRRPGLAMLRREVDRAHRSSGALTAAFIAVDGLGALDDTQRHSAGETLLCAVAGTLLAGLRSYDLVIRVGGDAFACALCDVTIADTRTRFSALQQAIARSGITIRVGCAELAAHDTPATLIDRAEAGLPTTRTGPDDDVRRPARRQHPEGRPPAAGTSPPTVATAVAESRVGANEQPARGIANAAKRS